MSSGVELPRGSYNFLAIMKLHRLDQGIRRTALTGRGVLTCAGKMGEREAAVYQSMTVVDDFYPQPQEVRKAALALDYPPPSPTQNHAGRNSAKRLMVRGVDEAVSEIVGTRLTGNMKSAHGRCRITLAADKSRFNVHIDEDTEWAGIVYLNLPDQCQGGTDFFRHKPTGSERAPITDDELAVFGVATVQEAVAQVLEADSNDPDKWELVMTLPMRFNRLVLFRPWLWHTAAGAFGDSDDIGRLVQLFFFIGRDAAQAAGR